MDTAFELLLSERLVLRRFSSADAGPLARYRSLPAVARYQGWDAPYPLEAARGFVAWLAARHPDAPGEWYQVAIATREDPDRLIGDVGFRARDDEPAIVDIGFTLDPAVQGRGFATEAVGEIVRYLFSDRGKHKICADCDMRNARSWRLLERLGFRREGELRSSYRDGDRWADEFLYGLVVDDWRSRAAGRR
jgi:RimJ/RimL family protein N-acetyltransferase